MFRETSTSFFLLTLPSGNLLGVPAGTYFPGNPVSVEDGYYIMLDKLSLGAHSLHFHGEIPARNGHIERRGSIMVGSKASTPMARASGSLIAAGGETVSAGAMGANVRPKRTKSAVIFLFIGSPAVIARFGCAFDAAAALSNTGAIDIAGL